MNASSVVNFCKNYVLCINVIKEYWAQKSIKKQIVFYFSWEECLYFIPGINARSQINFSSVVCYKRDFWKQVTSCGMRSIWQQFPKLMPRSGHVWQDHVHDRCVRRAWKPDTKTFHGLRCVCGSPVDQS